MLLLFSLTPTRTHSLSSLQNIPTHSNNPLTHRLFLPLSHIKLSSSITHSPLLSDTHLFLPSNTLSSSPLTHSSPLSLTSSPPSSLTHYVCSRLSHTLLLSHSHTLSPLTHSVCSHLSQTLSLSYILSPTTHSLSTIIHIHTVSTFSLTLHFGQNQPLVVTIYLPLATLHLNLLTISS